jgi:hypothetical protein
MVSTDSMMGGKSPGPMQADADCGTGGAQGSKGALNGSGEVLKGYAFPWSGAM